ncbi:hypothetical protein V1478_008831 [Vespula squamosa]|uniref:Uncharacterized protein n=1 Tax=Vespula squamosa TaxID=30214 RepID=A0ABD2AUP2_VESSQ
MGALARHQSAIIGRQVVRGSIFRRTPAKPYGRPPAEGTTSAVRPMGAKGRPLNVTRATNYCTIPETTKHEIFIGNIRPSWTNT